MPATYRLRGLPQRKKLAVEMGATEASELAVERSLRWLAAHQSEEGFWDADGFTRMCPPAKNVVDSRDWGATRPTHRWTCPSVNGPVSKRMRG